MSQKWLIRLQDSNTPTLEATLAKTVLHPMNVGDINVGNIWFSFESYFSLVKFSNTQNYFENTETSCCCTVILGSQKSNGFGLTFPPIRLLFDTNHLPYIICPIWMILWRCLKDETYRQNSQPTEELEQYIYGARESISADMMPANFVFCHVVYCKWWLFLKHYFLVFATVFATSSYRFWSEIFDYCLKKGEIKFSVCSRSPSVSVSFSFCIHISHFCDTLYT